MSSLLVWQLINQPINNKLMISQEQIKSFLEGNDPEEFIVAVEYDYASDSIFKIKEIPTRYVETREDATKLVLWKETLRFMKGVWKIRMGKQ